ncbi:RidA family protein [Nocardia aurantiaca]|uniref:RidA family protein n=1 Tax=Nocardia aurantiaca TaxID=2675850 RepID=A0A6I3KW29_9NOCA|nr:RidA family protein [Nocardia aurantiaca]MTE12244.1 RidA family protein [Nocardia aurantiaca]
MAWAENLKKLGLELPPAPPPVAVYVAGVRTGNYVYTSGQLPFVNGQLPLTGKVGAELTIEQGAEMAKLAALNALAVVHDLVGLDNVVRIVKVVGFVASAPGFNDQPLVINGASELLGEVLGEAGVHARSAVGTSELPKNTPVEVELIAEVR